MGKASNILLVCSDGAGVSAERNLVLPEEHSYPGDFCTCSNAELVPAFLLDPAHSGARGVKQLQEGPQPVCHPGEAQIRRKPSITLVKEVKKKSSNYKRERGKSKSWGSPLGSGVCVEGCRAAAGKRFLM